MQNTLNNVRCKAKFIYIVPSSRSIDEAKTTLQSIDYCSRNSRDVFMIILILNGELGNSELSLAEFDVEIVVLRDVNITNVSAARNLGLNYLERFEYIQSFICFLDGGDVLVKVPRISWSPKTIYRTRHYELSSRGKYDAFLFPLAFKEFVNPFAIGATYVSSEIIRDMIRFREGRKEDWKYWLECLACGYGVRESNLRTYVYTTSGSVSHATRKLPLYKEQVKFFANRSRSNGLTLYLDVVFKFLVHIFLNSLKWTILRKKK
ncbi:hypothetical protein UM181_00915 [Alphaproteobacteria bacterium US3C007]|nr:hypothetical protein UM181_00915 [Alphaproteobacteria bacterium US3C007]